MLLCYSVNSVNEYVILKLTLHTVQQVRPDEGFVFAAKYVCPLFNQGRLQMAQPSLQRNAKFLETSAVTGHNIDRVFDCIAEGLSPSAFHKSAPSTSHPPVTHSPVSQQPRPAARSYMAIRFLFMLSQ